MKEPTTFVGLDVHKETIAVTMLPADGAAVSWQIPHEPAAVRRLATRLREAAGGAVETCYEAGGSGFTLQRQLRAAGVGCTVVAPSLIPVKPGDHIKTDRRDARKLAELFRARLLTAVQPPTAAEESVRDLCRAREDVVADLGRAKRRLNTFLLRRGLVYRRARTWGCWHRNWLHGVRFELAVDQQVFDHYLAAVEHLEDQRQTLDTHLAAAAAASPYAEPVGWLRCFRGIDTVTALTVVAELHGFHRFTGPRPLMAYLGLVPREASSGDRHRRAGITKAGNAHVRRVLIEAAWHYRHRAGVGTKLRQRRSGQPAWAIALADRAQQRLCRRYARLAARGKPSTKIIPAIARELVGFLWAALFVREQLAA
jgi:transposase